MISQFRVRVGVRVRVSNLGVVNLLFASTSEGASKSW